MAFPRIDHPEFAEFIRRFYGVSKPEVMAQRPPAQDQADTQVADPNLTSHAEMATGRRNPRGIGQEVNGG